MKHNITLHEGVVDVIRNGNDRIGEARKWTWETPITDDFEADAKLAATRREQVDKMSASFHEGLTRLLSTPSNDGDLEVWPDGELGLFWRYASGYHGGFVFHASYENGEQLPVGTWSIHT
jgi:hypothetical protein